MRGPLYRKKLLKPLTFGVLFSTYLGCGAAVSLGSEETENAEVKLSKSDSMLEDS
jgi:hypothetical protein